MLSNKWIGLIGIILAIGGIAATVTTFLVMWRYRELAYAVNPSRTAVLRKGEASCLKIFHDKREVTDDVTAIQIAIWNDGRESIRREHVLSPITLVTEPPVRILEATIKKRSREVVGFELKHSGDGFFPFIDIKVKNRHFNAVKTHLF